MAGNGGHLYFATYDSGTPTDVSKMIRFSPDATLSPKMFMGDDGSAESTFRVGGPTNGVFVKGGASGSLVSGSITSTGSLGRIETTTAGVRIGGYKSEHNYPLEVEGHAYVRGPDGWNGNGDLAIVALGSHAVNENFGVGYKYGTGMIMSIYKSGGNGSFGSSTADAITIADTTGNITLLEGADLSGSLGGSGSLGYLRIEGATAAARNLEVTGSAGFTHGLRLGRSSSDNRGLIVLEKNNNADDTGLAWLNTGGSYSATMYVSKSVGDFVFANSNVAGGLGDQQPNFVISSSGDIRMNSGKKFLFDNADAEGHTYISETADDTLKIFAGGQEMIKFVEGSDDRVTIGSTSHLVIQDNKALILGGSDDVVIQHSTSTGGIIDNHTNDLII
jgi:hypothetical protein